MYIHESRNLSRIQHKVICVPIGIAPVIYDFRAAEAIRASMPGKKLVFALGRLVPYKDFGTLVEAARFLSDDYMVLIGGSGPLKEELQQQIDSNGLQDKVRLLGYLESWDVPNWFGARTTASSGTFFAIQ